MLPRHRTQQPQPGWTKEEEAALRHFLATTRDQMKLVSLLALCSPWAQRAQHSMLSMQLCFVPIYFAPPPGSGSPQSKRGALCVFLCSPGRPHLLAGPCSATFAAFSHPSTPRPPSAPQFECAAELRVEGKVGAAITVLRRLLQVCGRLHGSSAPAARGWLLILSGWG